MDDLTARTILLWSALGERAMTDEDARHVIEDTAGFFTQMAEWDQSVAEAREPA